MAGLGAAPDTGEDDAGCVGRNKGDGKLSADFPAEWTGAGSRDECGPVTPSTLENGNTMPVYLAGFSVTKRNSLVIFFFTSRPDMQFPGNEYLYQTDRLRVDEIDLANGLLVINKTADLKKTSQPGKGDVLGPVTIGTIEYTEIP